MPQQDSGKKEQTNAELYLAIGRVLQKTHSPDAQEEIQKVLDSTIELQEKLAKLEQIDTNDGKAKNSPFPQMSPIHSKSVTEAVKARQTLTLENAHRNAIVVKQKLYKSRFLAYLFTEYPNIAQFARQTLAMKASIFNLKLTVKKTSLIAIPKDAAQLKNYLEPVLENGWGVLSKHDYNLIVLLKRLCDALILANWNFQDDPSLFLEKLRSVENYFLACHYKPDYPEIMITGITTAMEAYQKHLDKIEQAVGITKRLLFQNSDSGCLWNLILSLNMIQYHKYFKLRDLIQEMPGGVISPFEFDCTDTVYNKIREAVFDYEKKLEENCKSKLEVSKMNQFLRQFIHQNEGSRESCDYGLMILFYESGAGPEHYRYSRDKDNIFILINNLILRFLHEFQGILGGRCRLDGVGETILFTYDFFHFELSKIENFSQRLSRMAFGAVPFPNDRFVEIKHNPEHANMTQSELQFVQLVDEFSNTIMELGRKTGHLSQSYHLDNSLLSVDAADYKPLDPSVLMRNHFFIPYWDNRIIAPVFLKDKSLGQGLSAITTLCFLIGIYFYNARMLSLLEKEAHLNNEIQKLKNSIERIADIPTFEAIKARYNL